MIHRTNVVTFQQTQGEMLDLFATVTTALLLKKMVNQLPRGSTLYVRESRLAFLALLSRRGWVKFRLRCSRIAFPIGVHGKPKQFENFRQQKPHFNQA